MKGFEIENGCFITYSVLFTPWGRKEIALYIKYFRSNETAVAVFIYVRGLSGGAVSSSDQMVLPKMNAELQRMWKEAAVAYLKALPRHPQEGLRKTTKALVRIIVPR
jgi:hypothetical protein